MDMKNRFPFAKKRLESLPPPHPAGLPTTTPLPPG